MKTNKTHTPLNAWTCENHQWVYVSLVHTYTNSLSVQVKFHRLYLFHYTIVLYATKSACGRLDRLTSVMSSGLDLLSIKQQKYIHRETDVCEKRTGYKISTTMLSFPM